MKTLAKLLLLASLAFPLCGLAQSMQVFGANSYASNCYRESAAATKIGNASFADLENCNQAIEYGRLPRQDLLATYVNRGILYSVMGNLSKAAEDYRRALDMDAEVAETYVNRGNLWFMAERFQEAIADYDRAQELGIKQQHILFLNRGMAYELLGELDLAEENYLSSLGIAPEWAPAIERLKRVERKRTESAVGAQESSI